MPRASTEVLAKALCTNNSMHQDKRLVTLLLEMVFGQDKGIFQKRQFDDKVIWILNPIPYTYKLSLKSIIELSELNRRRGFCFTEQRSTIRSSVVKRGEQKRQLVSLDYSHRRPSHCCDDCYQRQVGRDVRGGFAVEFSSNLLRRSQRYWDQLE